MGISVAQTGTASKVRGAAPGDTLADFAFGLQAGSRCFCCGSTLVSTMQSDGSVILGCLECEAAVSTVDGLVLQRAA